MNHNKHRPHGWHWWRGPSGQMNVSTAAADIPRWHVVHCWLAERSHEPMADSAHFPKPKKQSEMGASGTWGPEVTPPPSTAPQDTGEKWPLLYLDESCGCFGDVRRQDKDEPYILIQPVGPPGSRGRNEQRQAIGREVVKRWNACQGIADPEKAIADIRDDLKSLKASLSKIDGMISWEHDSDMNTEMETAMNALNAALAQLNGRARE